MINSQIAGIEDPQLVERGEKIRIGDTVDVGVRIKEGEKERIQVFSGTVIRIKGDGVRKTFTVRRIVQGEGVERIFPFHSPKIDSVKVKRRGDVRRAKLYYLRDRVGKGTRVKEKIWAKEDEEKRAAKKAGKRRGKKGAETAAPETATATATNESAEAKE